MFKSLLTSILRSLGATVIEKGSEALVKKLEPKDGTDFSEPAQVKPRRKLAQIYADELMKLTAMQSTCTTGWNENELARLRSAIVTQMAKVSMYKTRLDAQSPTV